MSEQAHTPTTSGDSARFGDTPLAFELTRFEAKGHHESRSVWRFAVSRYIGRRLIEIDADPDTLREMQRYIERAIETVQTDGGRATPSKSGEADQSQNTENVDG